MRQRLRLLPFLVVAGGLALTARIGDLWHGVAVMAQDRPAQTSLPPGTHWIVEPVAGKDPTAPDVASPEAPSQEAALSAKAAAGGVFQLPPDPLTMTDEEVRLLQALAERREELDRRGSRVDEREALLKAAERRIEEQVDGLKALQKSIEALLKQHEEETESQYNSLVKIYENMRPKDAARIFEELDMAVLLPVVERMKERKTAPILAKMDPVKAKAITTELAQRRELPSAR